MNSVRDSRIAVVVRCRVCFVSIGSDLERQVRIDKDRPGCKI